jgi:hypothetical protein
MYSFETLEVINVPIDRVADDISAAAPFDASGACPHKTHAACTVRNIHFVTLQL